MERQHLLVQQSNGMIFGSIMLPDPDVGPTIPPSLAPPGMRYVAYAGAFSRVGRRETEAAYWHDAVEWVEALPLAAIKERKRAEVTAERLRADGDCFTYQGVKIRTADKDMNDLLVTNARIQMGEGMPLNWVGGWIGIDGIVFISTREEWKTFFIAMYDAGIANFMYSQQLKAQIEDAATAAQVELIKWESA